MFPAGINWFSSFLDRPLVKHVFSEDRKGFWQQIKVSCLSAQILELPPVADPRSVVPELLHRRHNKKVKMKIKRSKRNRGNEIA